MNFTLRFTLLVVLWVYDSTSVDLTKFCTKADNRRLTLQTHLHRKTSHAHMILDKHSNYTEKEFWWSKAKQCGFPLLLRQGPKPKLFFGNKQFKMNISFKLCVDRIVTPHTQVGWTYSGYPCRNCRKYTFILERTSCRGHRCRSALPVRSLQDYGASCEVIITGGADAFPVRSQWGTPSSITAVMFSIPDGEKSRTGNKARKHTWTHGLSP